MSFQNSATKSIFQERLTHGFHQKFEISSLSDNVLNGKKGFLDYKNVILT